MTITALPTPPARSDTPATFISLADAFLGALPTFATEANALAAAMNLNSTTDTSASSVLIGTGAKSFTVSAGKSFVGGMFLVIADAAAPSTNYMQCQVTSYSGTTLSVNCVTTGGSGTKSSWVISQSSALAPSGGVMAGAGVNVDITQLTAINAASIPAVGLKTSAVPSVPMLNGTIEWTTSGNALTAAVKTLAGTDPSATDPVFVVFRDPTLTTAGYYVRSITAALSVTASSGSTLGTVSAQASRIRCVAMDNGGTVVLGLYNPWNDTTKSLVGINEGLTYSSTAEGGAGAADSAQVIYTTSAQTSKAVREVSYMDSTQATAGTWATALTNKVQITPTTPKTGAVLQSINTSSSALVTGTTVMPYDDTIPQNSEGVAFSALDTAITPLSASNKLEVNVIIGATENSGGGNQTLALFEDSVANALAAVSEQGAASAPFAIALTDYTKIANTVSAKTFKSRIGSANAGTQSINGSGGARKHGGVAHSMCTVKEVMV